MTTKSKSISIWLGAVVSLFIIVGSAFSFVQDYSETKSCVQFNKAQIEMFEIRSLKEHQIVMFRLDALNNLLIEILNRRCERQPKDKKWPG